MKARNLYVYGKPEFVERVASEYEFLGLYVKRVPGGLMVPAIQPNAKKRDDGTWGWTFKKSRDEKSKREPKRETRKRDRS